MSSDPNTTPIVQWYTGIWKDILQGITPGSVAHRRLAQYTLILAIILSKTSERTISMLNLTEEELVGMYDYIQLLDYGENDSYQITSMLRALFEMVNDNISPLPNLLNRDLIIKENANLLCSFFEMTESTATKHFNPNCLKLLLKRSNIFTNREIDDLELPRLSKEMSLRLNIGFTKEYKDIPLNILNKMNSNQFENFVSQLERVRGPTGFVHYVECLVPTFLICSVDFTGELSDLVKTWVRSARGEGLFQQTADIIVGDRPYECLGFFFTARLCLEAYKYDPPPPDSSTRLNAPENIHIRNLHSTLFGAPISSVDRLETYFVAASGLHKELNPSSKLKPILEHIMKQLNVTQDAKFLTRYWAGRRNGSSHARTMELTRGMPMPRA